MLQMATGTTFLPQLQATPWQMHQKSPDLPQDHTGVIQIHAEKDQLHQQDQIQYIQIHEQIKGQWGKSWLVPKKVKTVHLHTLIPEDNGEWRNPFAQEKMNWLDRGKKKLKTMMKSKHKTS